MLNQNAVLCKLTPLKETRNRLHILVVLRVLNIGINFAQNY